MAPRGNNPEPIRFNDFKAAPAKECLHVPLRRWTTGPPTDDIAQAMAQPGEAPSIQMIVDHQYAIGGDDCSQPVENAFTQMVLCTQDETK